MALEFINRRSHSDQGTVALAIHKAPAPQQNTSNTVFDLYISVPPEVLNKIGSPNRIDIALDGDSKSVYIFKSAVGLKIAPRGTGAKRKSARVRITGRTEKLVDRVCPVRSYVAEFVEVEGVPAIKVHCPELFRKPLQKLNLR